MHSFCLIHTIGRSLINFGPAFVCLPVCGLSDEYETFPDTMPSGDSKVNEMDLVEGSIRRPPDKITQDGSHLLRPDLGVQGAPCGSSIAGARMNTEVDVCKEADTSGGVKDDETIGENVVGAREGGKIEGEGEGDELNQAGTKGLGSREIEKESLRGVEKNVNRRFWGAVENISTLLPNPSEKEAAHELDSLSDDDAAAGDVDVEDFQVHSLQVCVLARDDIMDACRGSCTGV